MSRPIEVWLIEIDALDEYDAATTLRFTSGAGMITGPSDTPANTIFYGQIAKGFGAGGLISKSAFSQGATYGVGSIGYGTLTLLNLDGSLDYLLDYAIDGQEVRIYFGVEGSAFPSGFTLADTLVAEQMIHGDNRVEITFLDRMADLDEPLCTALLLGNNSLPNGIEGGADQKDTPKPRLYGTANNFSPINVNTSKNIWLICANQAAVSAARDRGASLVAGAAYSSQSDMETNAPAASNYRVWSSAAGTYVRLGSSLVGTLTVDVSTTETKAASLVEQVLIDAGIPALDISAADVYDLDSVNSSSVGWMATGTESARDVCERLLSGVGGFLYPDVNNTFRMDRLEVPVGPADLTINHVEIVSCRIIASGNNDRGLPAYRVVLKHDKNWTTQDDLDQTTTGAVAAAYYEKEYREASSEDQTILYRHPLAATIELETTLNDRANADTEADRLLSLYGEQRRTYEVVCRLTDTQLTACEINNVVSVTNDPDGRIRLGLNAKMLRIIGVALDNLAGRAVLTLWG